jgi:glycosyltransferase involved in cell wall biosynthesis
MIDNLVSIILPTFNSEEYIEETILSVTNQNYTNWELIIVDDCSSDNTIELLTKIQGIYLDKIKLFKNSVNLGADKTRNTAIKQANGRYIAFIDADDAWSSDKLTKQLDFMSEINSGFCYTSSKISQKNKKSFVRNVPRFSRRKDILKNNCICTSTVIIDRSIIKKIYMPQIRKGQDLATWLLILRTLEVADGFNQPLTTYNKRYNSLSSNKLNSALWVWMLYRDIEKMNFLPALYYFCFYAINGVKKHFLESNKF